MGIWRLIEDTPRSGSFNMAADQMLLDSYMIDSRPVLRIYEWDCPTLTLGRNEEIDNGIDLRVCENLKIPIIRRSTGGSSVLHGFDITYSLVGGIFNTCFSENVLDNYRYISKGFYRFFEELGLKPELQEKTPLKKGLSKHICFSLPSAYEILVEGRKIIGNAQKVRNIKRTNSYPYRVFLQHGTIPLKDSISLISQIFPRIDKKKLSQKMHSLESIGIFPRLSKKKIKQLLYKSLRETFDLQWETKTWSDEELNKISNFKINYQPLKNK